MLRRKVVGCRSVVSLAMGCMLGLLTTLRVPSAPPELPVLRLIPSQASIYDWQVLSGVGPVLAGRLHDALHGLACVDEAVLDDVPGVGPVRLEQWSDLLVLSVQP